MAPFALFATLAPDQLPDALNFGQSQGKQEGNTKGEYEDCQRVDQREPLVKGSVWKRGADQDFQQEKMQNIDSKGLTGQCG